MAFNGMNQIAKEAWMVVLKKLNNNKGL